MTNLTQQLKHMDAIALAELVRNGEVNPIELVEAAIAQIEAKNPQLNAVVTPMYDLARDMARAELPDAPFAGVPFLIKESTSHANVRQSNGARMLANFKSEHDSEIVRRYKQAGLIPLGKTNMSEFGLLPTTESKLFGPTYNPWDRSRMPGGSSGGSAAAVASRLIPVAHGADGGGSIRIPAACCGVFGMKPTRARTPKGPGVGDSISGLVIDHVITWSVRDSAAILDVTAGAALGDPYWAPPQERPFLTEVTTDPGQLRIGFMVDAINDVPVHPDCVAAVRETAVLCESLGHHVEEVTLPIDNKRFMDAFIIMWAAGCGWGVKGIAHLSGIPAVPEQYEPVTWGLYELSERTTSADYLSAVQIVQQNARKVAHFFTNYDALLMPVLAEPPMTLGSFDSTPENPMAGFERAIEVASFTGLANATGQPAMSVPLVWNADNLPIGVQFVGRFGDEATLFRLAGQLEKARPWANQIPELDES